jgi:methanogenic corrinoid protein MtbC1
MPERVQPRAGHLFTSAEVARAFRAGVSSIKRWTDEGELESVRTPGGHRRYTLSALYRFASIRNLGTDLLPAIEQPDLFEEIPLPADITLFDALRIGDADAVRKLVTPHVDTLVQRASFLDRVVGDALRQIGERWERGSFGVDEEHRASNIIIDAVDRMRPRLPRDARVALLACPPDELHDLPLRLVRLMFEWAGWRTELLGASLPWTSAADAVERMRPAIAGFSARSAAPFQSVEFAQFVESSRARGAVVIVGGEWARGGAGGDKGYLRFRTMRGFEKWLRGFRTPPAPASA